MQPHCGRLSSAVFVFVLQMYPRFCKSQCITFLPPSDSMPAILLSVRQWANTLHHNMVEACDPNLQRSCLSCPCFSCSINVHLTSDSQEAQLVQLPAWRGVLPDKASRLWATWMRQGKKGGDLVPDMSATYKLDRLPALMRASRSFSQPSNCARLRTASSQSPRKSASRCFSSKAKPFLWPHKRRAASASPTLSLLINTLGTWSPTWSAHIPSAHTSPPFTGLGTEDYLIEGLSQGRERGSLAETASDQDIVSH